MNYRFNGTDYTEDQMTKVADVKGYTLEELISKNPKIETIVDEEVEKTQVVAEDAAPVTADTPAVEDTELVSENISSDGQPTDPPWEPKVFTSDGKVDTSYYEKLGIMEVEKQKYNAWKENQYNEAEQDFYTPGSSVAFTKPSDLSLIHI